MHRAPAPSGAPSPRRRAALAAAGLAALTATGLLAAPAGAAPAPTPTPTPTATPTATPTPTTTAPPVRPQVVPLPAVSAPLPTTATSHAFGAAAYQGVPEDLAAKGYEEREYTISGTANVYDWPAPGPAVVRTAGAPYTTRILVRRPIKGARSSGTVVVEPLNPSNLFDLNIGWAMMNRQLVANGDTWVGVTVKPVSIVALQRFDPQRYAALSMANPLGLDDPRNCTTVAADSSRTTENGLAWDIMSQVGRLVAADDARNPARYAPGRPPAKVYGFGYSQTGGYMYDYVNGIRPLALRAPGRQVYDGYIGAVGGGAFVGAGPIKQCSPGPPRGDPRRQFGNVGVPCVHVMSQSG